MVTIRNESPGITSSGCGGLGYEHPVIVNKMIHRKHKKRPMYSPPITARINLLIQAATLYIFPPTMRINGKLLPEIIYMRMYKRLGACFLFVNPVGFSLARKHSWEKR